MSRNKIYKAYAFLHLQMAEGELSRRLKMIGSALMLVIGISFYWGYGLAYGEWNIFSPGNDGVYSIVVFFVGIGAIGMLLFRKRPAGQ